MGVHVPDDVLFNHILPRVPAESVRGFKCVSKEWHSFLTSDTFKNKHNCHVDDHKNNPKLLVLYRTETSFEFTTIDCEAPPISDKGLTPTRRPLPQFEGINPRYIRILTSFHGLVCLGIIKDKHDVEYSDLILWNPLTNEYKRLSKSNSHMECWHSYFSNFGLYYSFGEDDYKLLFVDYYDNKVCIYSLKSDSWRKVYVFQHISILYHGRWRSGGTYLNENLYFLQQHSNGQYLPSIIRFDTKTERLSQIETPSLYYYGNTYDYSATIMAKSDCIHVCVKYDISISCDNGFRRKTCIKLWKLDEYGNMKEVVTYQLKPHVYDIPTLISRLIPFHLMKNGKWLLRDRSSCHRIYEVDLKKKKHIKDKGKGKEEGNIYDDFECVEVRFIPKNKRVAEEGRYIETFVSPNRYMK